MGETATQPDKKSPKHVIFPSLLQPLVLQVRQFQ